MGYLLARAYFSRRVLWIIGAFFAALIFSGVFAALLPSIGDGAQLGPVRSAAPWQANLAGFAAGIGVGWLLHPRKRKTAEAR
jgi:membrane associated rhomboid family serine protease